MTAPVYVSAKANTTAFTDTVTVSSVNGGSAANRCILALLWGYGDASGTITGAKCNGVSMTACAAVANTAGSNYKFRMFATVSDSTITTGSTNSVEADFAGGVITHGMVFAASFSGVSAVSAGIVATLSNQSPAWNGIAGATGDLAVVLAMMNNAVGHTWTGGTGVTIDYNSGTGMFSSLPALVLEKASALGVNITASISGSGDGWLGVGVSLAAVATSTAKTRRTLGPRIGSRQGGFVRLGSGLIAPRRFAANEASFLEAA